MRTALIIIDPPSLNQAVCLGQGSEPVDIAAQGGSIPDDVRAIEVRQISQYQGLLHPLHLLQITPKGFLPFVANVAGLSVGILIV